MCISNSSCDLAVGPLAVFFYFVVAFLVDFKSFFLFHIFQFFNFLLAFLGMYIVYYFKYFLLLKLFLFLGVQSALVAHTGKAADCSKSLHTCL